MLEDGDVWTHTRLNIREVLLTSAVGDFAVKASCVALMLDIKGTFRCFPAHTFTVDGQAVRFGARRCAVCPLYLLPDTMKTDSGKTAEPPPDRNLCD